jgi:hypothetical protein
MIVIDKKSPFLLRCRDEVSCSGMQHGDLPIYSIGAVERMLDIPAATIRNWEERYGLVA